MSDASARTSKPLAVALSVIGYLVTTYAAVTDQIPASWAGAASAAVAALYLALRTLDKVKRGEDPKTLLSTTEFWGCSLVAVANLGMALASKVTYLQAGGVAAGLAVALKVGRALGGTIVGPPEEAKTPQLRVVKPDSRVGASDPDDSSEG
jgi:hypothetical protein